MVPDGVRVFLFTDIEGSTRRWERGDIAMPEALAQHDTILAGAITGAGGQVFKHLGDGMAATFPSVAGAAQAAVSAQVALLAAEWPPDADLRVRMGIHAGHATERDNDYFGATVNRAARLMSAGHGGQILLSGAAKALLDLPDDAWVITVMGSHYLRDLAEPAVGLGEPLRPLRGRRLARLELGVELDRLVEPAARPVHGRFVA